MQHALLAYNVRAIPGNGCIAYPRDGISAASTQVFLLHLVLSIQRIPSVLPAAIVLSC
jgi:hypothetical protein